VFDDPSQFIRANEIDGNTTKIVLFHGALNNAVNDQGFHLENENITLDIFSGFDYGFFGDIHTFQYLDDSKRFAYAGSLIQQNFGESLQHGFIEWDIKNSTSKFHRVKNDWGYHTIDVENGQIAEQIELSPISRVRIRTFNTTSSDLFKIVTKIKTLYTIEDLRVQKFSESIEVMSEDSKNISLVNVRDVEYQNSLIADYVRKTFQADDTAVASVIDINREINHRLTVNSSLRNVVWTPIKFEFSNMFSYGENNVINFDKLHGTYGIFAPNASGKSSILDSLMFCIFDKCSRSFKASQVLNNKKDEFWCKLQFKIGDKKFFIERSGKKSRSGHVKVTVDFWYEDQEGQKQSLNGEDRDGTNFAIRSYLGTYDDFIITTMSLQKDNTNFIDKQQRERKDLLAQFLDLNVFEELQLIATEDSKEVQAVMKKFAGEEYSTQIANTSESLLTNRKKLQELTETKDQLVRKILDTNDVVLDLTKQLHKVDGNSMNIDVNAETQNITDSNEKLSTIHEKILDVEAQKQQFEAGVLELKAKLDEYDSNDIAERKQKLEDASSKLSELRTSKMKLSTAIQNLNEKVESLEKFEYDPDCKFCVENIFVKDALRAKESLPTKMLELAEVESNIVTTSEIKESLSSVLDSVAKVNDLNTKIIRAYDVIKKLEGELSTLHRMSSQLKESIVASEKKISMYNENQDSIEHNRTLELRIDQLQLERDQFTASLQSTESSIVSTSNRVSVMEREIKECTDALAELKILEQKQAAFDMYLAAVNRNGVPYDLIGSIIPRIQNEVNSILSQIVDFEILFETDGKSINAYIVYGEEDFWPLEMTSGMERFISSLAIRTALINVSTLSHPNFIVIDEGFGVLDSNNLNSLYSLFDYLKTNFDFIFVISHLDALRDIMDNIVDIQKIDGVSMLQY